MAKHYERLLRYARNDAYMPLDTGTLESSLRTAFDTAHASTDSSAVITLCAAIAAAMKTFVESATVTMVATTIVAPSGGGSCVQSGPTIANLT